MTFYSPLGFLLLVSIPGIIILYLLKQKHAEYIVSSLYLWQEALKDLEANAPWQKLRKNILMILQIIAVVLLALALSNPFLKDVGGNSNTVVVAIDTSMSMQAIDVKPNRFEAAKKAATDFVSNLEPGTKVTLIEIGSNTEILENLSNDRSLLLDSISGLKVTNLTADYGKAASLIDSITRQDKETDVEIFGDVMFDMPGIDYKFSSFNEKGSNYAILLLSHTRSESSITALSRVANYSDIDAELPISLYSDGKVIDAKKVEVKNNSVANVYWNGIPADTATLECRLDIEDSLMADNNAWDTPVPSKKSKVLLASEKNIFLEKILSLTDDVELYKCSPADINGLKGYDLYIFDGMIPDKLPMDGNIILLDPVSNGFFSVNGYIELPTVLKSGHELFRHVSDYSFVIGKAVKLDMPDWGEEVLSSKDWPLIFAGQPDNRRFVVFGFDLHDSDITLKPVFPILMTDILDWLLPANTKITGCIIAGQEISFNPDPKAETIKAVTPSGKLINVAPPFPAGVFSNTSEIGIYSLQQKGKDFENLSWFAVNPPAISESNLRDKGNREVSTTTGSINTGIAKKGLRLKDIFLWLVLIILLLEWRVYTRGI
jgi:Uncharacterized conserved protein (some members contain a von Willebrand factor type A (vWA) domain)